tara:strand:+ start:173 stop:730 length:558 start_codon:yes stop_codon:yes gene_type:complete
MSKKNISGLLEISKEEDNFNEKLGLDNRDKIILSLISKHSNISQEEIAKHIKLSQPSVGARIKKLRQKGILHNVNGVNFRIVNLNLAKVDVNSTDTTSIINEFKDCPFFINALITSGKYNLCLFFTAIDLKRLEGIVNHHLRNNSKVKDVELNLVISTTKDFVLPLNINHEDKKNLCDEKCKYCI